MGARCPLNPQPPPPKKKKKKKNSIRLRIVLLFFLRVTVTLCKQPGLNIIFTEYEESEQPEMNG